MKTMTTEEYQKYIDEEELGYIKINKHPENENIVILNYTEMVTFERRWNEQTMSSRGLILDLTYAKNNNIIYILAKPFEKFFNYGENLDYEKDIDFNEIESVMEKMDGSLGISYIINGELRFATRGSFTSEQALKATEIWKNKYSDANRKYMRIFTENHPTFLVEIIYPENRIVVDYNGEEKLVLLGIMSDEKDVDFHIVKQVGDYFRLPVVPQYEFTLEKMLEMKKSISANEEGWILRFKNGKRLKIKGDEYIGVHRIIHGLSIKAKYKAWSEDNLQDFIRQLPEEFRPELEEFGREVDNIYTIIHNTTELLYRVFKVSDRKEYALKVNQYIPKEYRKFMFEIFKTEQVPEIMIKEHIYKNYKEYAEMIAWNK